MTTATRIVEAIAAGPTIDPAEGELRDDLLLHVQAHANELKRSGVLRVNPPPTWIRPQVLLHEPPLDDNVKLNAHAVAPLDSCAVGSQAAAGSHTGGKLMAVKGRMRLLVRDFRVMDLLRRNDISSEKLHRKAIAHPLARAEDMETIYWQSLSDGTIDHLASGTYFAEEQLKRHILRDSDKGFDDKCAWHCGTVSMHPCNPLSSMPKLMKAERPISISFSQIYRRSPWQKHEYQCNTLLFNYFGEARIIYVVAPSKAHTFERFCRQKNLGPTSNEMIRVSLMELKQGGVRGLRRTVLRQQQYVVVASGSYYCTLDVGFNITQSAYFAIPDWLLSAESLKTVLPWDYIVYKCIERVAMGGWETPTAVQIAINAAKPVIQRHEALLEVARVRKYRVSLYADAPEGIKRSCRSFDSKDPKDHPACSVCAIHCHLSALVHWESADEFPTDRVDYRCGDHCESEDPGSWFLLVRYPQIAIKMVLQKAFDVGSLGELTALVEDENVQMSPEETGFSDDEFKEGSGIAGDKKEGEEPLPGTHKSSYFNGFAARSRDPTRPTHDVRNSELRSTNEGDDIEDGEVTAESPKLPKAEAKVKRSVKVTPAETSIKPGRENILGDRKLDKHKSSMRAKDAKVVDLRKRHDSGSSEVSYDRHDGRRQKRRVDDEYDYEIPKKHRSTR
mmetsp:Transcript_8952/g.26888  ORF Transcript_8952/g.26888 Transcript_8952/m.26888 type:complete len:674 (-) Transcript_8952:256-2277(-)